MHTSGTQIKLGDSAIPDPSATGRQLAEPRRTLLLTRHRTWRTAQIQADAGSPFSPRWRRLPNPRPSIGRSAAASRTPDGAAARSAASILAPAAPLPGLTAMGWLGGVCGRLDDERHPPLALLRGPPAHPISHHPLHGDALHR